MANRTQLQTALHKPYDRILFAKDILNPVFGPCFSLSTSTIAAGIQPNKSELLVIATVSIYGNITLEDSTQITCYEIVLQPKVRIEQSKVAIQRYVRKLLTAGQAALINFVSPQNKNAWRLTLVAKDSQLTDEGIKEKTTHAKRYTYLLGPSETCKTAAERFENVSTAKEITFEALVNAFSVEKLSKAFFDEYTQHYKNFIDHLATPAIKKTFFNGDEKAIRDFTKKLLGRIVFLYFVQKKGWLGASNEQYLDGDTNFIMNLFKKSGGNETFYTNYLTELFFNALNNEQRSKTAFKIQNASFGFVPFLNGGLFDKEEHDEHLLTFKAKLFHNPDYEDVILTEKNSSSARGFLDFLNAFNFTVHEDSPDDHTVAVDPEMLGHIFENLLEDNKDKGAFYTPKEIVHYMCQESLTEYLTTHLSKEYTVYKEIGKAQVELFGNESPQGQLKMIEQLGHKALNRDHLSFIVKHKDISQLTIAQLKRIDELLNTVKICDPAIGSGAFPMGLLQEIVAIKEVIHFELYQSSNSGIQKSSKSVIPTFAPAQVKENIIQHSIYGVDIEKGAVDIARLRFWLSLVVDEEKPRALPNLDYKIVVGNSLVSKYDGEIITIDWEIKPKNASDVQKIITDQQAKLWLLQSRQALYFTAHGNKTKLKKEIELLKAKVLINQLTLTKLSYEQSNPKLGGFAPTAKEILKNHQAQTTLSGYQNTIKKLEAFSGGTALDFFDWKLNFPEVLNSKIVKEVGFDIVIGNPPYVQMQKNGGELAKVLEGKKYETFERTGDIYALFYEQGFNLLKLSGIHTFITSSQWLRASYGKSLRKYFLKKNLLKLIELGPAVFDSAVVDTNILIGKNEDNQKHLNGIVVKSLKEIHGLSNADMEAMPYITQDAWAILNPVKQAIKQILQTKGKPLSYWDIEIYRGVLTGFNEAFIIDEEKKKELIKADAKSAEILKPILRGREIGKYLNEDKSGYIINSHNGVKSRNIQSIDINKYPAVKKYLDTYSEQLKLRQDIGETFYNLRNCAYLDEFSKEKIIWKNIGSQVRFAYSNREMYGLDTTCIATGEKIKYLTALLNSKLCIYQLFESAPRTGTGDLKQVFRQ